MSARTSKAIRHRLWLAAGIAVLAVAGCVPATQPSAEPRVNAPAAAAPATAAPRVLRVGNREEPKGGLGIQSAGGTGAAEFAYVFSAGLTAINAEGVIEPRLAQKVPRVEDGDWLLLPDGQMEVTWKLRPEARWHDGTPLTAADYEFGVRLLLDPDIPQVGADGYNARSIAGAMAPDPQTLVVRWKQPFLYANHAAPIALPAIPRHLLWDLYQQDKAQFVNSPHWTTAYVGVGPFRLTEWVEGSHLEGVAFDQYVLGRPKIDRIIMRILPDRNALVANLLAGEIDVIPVGNIGALELKTISDTWTPSGGGSAIPILQGIRHLLPQFRDPTTPWARDVRVREALAFALDRPAMAEVLQQGFTVPADASITPKDPTWPLLEARGFPRRPFDLGQTQRLMGTAGWTRGTDGLFRDAAGQPLTIEVRGGSDFAQELTVVAAQWKDAGFDSVLFVIPDTTADQRELQNSSRGVLATSQATNAVFTAFTEAEIGTAQNRWGGANRGGYRNPNLERLAQAWAANAFEESRRLPIQADILKIVADEVASIPLYYNVRGQAWSRNLRGPGPFENPITLVSSWNLHDWQLP